MKATNKKIYIVNVYGTDNDDHSTFNLHYFFKSLKNAEKFVEKEKNHINTDYGSWTQKGAYILNEKGHNLDDWRVK